ncbi:MAG: TIGR03084 family metal-binding protein [Motiliproteus sp.]
MLQQAYDFRDESDALYQRLVPLKEEVFETQTQFKGWTLNDILAHLHHYNHLALLSLQDEERFAREYGALKDARAAGKTMREASDLWLGNIKGRALLNLWRDFYLEMTESFAQANPKMRVKWAGPEMSVRSCISARLMETWAHAQAIYDALGVERVDTDRIKSIAIMGVNTFGWTFSNRKEDVPAKKPCVRLTAPSGDIWQWNEPDQGNKVEGSAVEFCQVVTQPRNIADTSLSTVGLSAERWMALAQCFAGAPNDPPAKGTRYRNGG